MTTRPGHRTVQASEIVEDGDGVGVARAEQAPALGGDGAREVPMTLSARYRGNVRLTRSAAKHGIDREEIRTVLAAPLLTVEQGESVLHVGLTTRRDLLEVVVSAVAGETTVLHAMRLRPANYHHMRGLNPPGRAL